jgi:hypothetical protein
VSCPAFWLQPSWGHWKKSQLHSYYVHRNAGTANLHQLQARTNWAAVDRTVHPGDWWVRAYLRTITLKVGPAKPLMIAEAFRWHRPCSTTPFTCNNDTSDYPSARPPVSRTSSCTSSGRGPALSNMFRQRFYYGKEAGPFGWTARCSQGCNWTHNRKTTYWA